MKDRMLMEIIRPVEIGSPAEKPTPKLEIVKESGHPDVADIFTARTRPDDDTSLIEFVDGLDWRYPRESKWIINVSTQYGCPVGCNFCDAAHKFYGNVSARDMLGQVRHVLDRHPGTADKCDKLKVHFARMGEPALNNQVLTALEQLPEMVKSPGLWACVPTTAPQGTENWFERLLKIRDYRYPGRFQLQFSINSTDQTYRAGITPVPLLPFSWINEFAARFYRPTERTVVLNFALGRGTPFDADELGRWFDPAHFCVKLTPMNPTDEGRSNGLESLIPDELNQACDRVRGKGFDVLLSIGDPREDDIGSNCGQSVRRIRTRTHA